VFLCSFIKNKHIEAAYKRLNFVCPYTTLHTFSNDSQNVSHLSISSFISVLFLYTVTLVFILNMQEIFDAEQLSNQVTLNQYYDRTS